MLSVQSAASSHISGWVRTITLLDQDQQNNFNTEMLAYRKVSMHFTFNALNTWSGLLLHEFLHVQCVLALRPVPLLRCNESPGCFDGNSVSSSVDQHQKMTWLSKTSLIPPVISK
ncbi:hypothetical protein AMECASPLE_002369 [Ameca splendens]|uniref:Uncharacterized protein n=1 Tax=Ameca splendens TaxID=208324 RepID=A0ABV0XY75_9TELE